MDPWERRVAKASTSRVRSKLPLTTWFSQLTIKELKKAGFLQDGKNTYWENEYPGHSRYERGLIFLEGEEKFVIIEFSNFSQVFGLVCFPQGTGLKWYFSHPHTGKLVRTLYKTDDGYVTRHDGLKYRRQYQTKAHRRLLDLDTLAYEIGGIFNGKKPARGKVRHKKLDKLRQLLREIENDKEGTAKAIAKVPAFSKTIKQAKRLLREGAHHRPRLGSSNAASDAR